MELNEGREGVVQSGEIFQSRSRPERDGAWPGGRGQAARGEVWRRVRWVCGQG